jgi:hypothetical protein
MGFETRTPTSNDPPRQEASPWGARELHDDVSLLLSGLGARCAGCSRVTRKVYLQEVSGRNLCPGCRGTKY